MAQITRIHGEWIHPIKGRRDRAHCITLKFVLTGSIPAKKNNQVAICSWQRADVYAEECFRTKGHLTKADYDHIKTLVAAYIVPSARHQQWHRKAKEVITTQMAKQLPLLQARGLIFPLTNCSMTIYHQWKDRTVRDLSNRLESLQDLFVDSLLIIDDSDRHLGPVKTDSGRYIGEITKHTTIINLTAYYGAE
jgi:hypothetical protein